MNQERRELLVNRILSGHIRCVNYQATNKDVYKIYSPNPSIKYEASEIYNEALNRSSYYEVMDDDKLESYLVRNKLWTPTQQDRLDSLPKEIEDVKVNLFNAINNAEQRVKLRQELDNKKQALEELFLERHAFDYLTCSGFAAYVKSKFILSSTVYKNGGLFYFESDGIFDTLLGMIAKERISESEYRELSRNEPWRSYWNLGKSQQLFGFPVCEYTDEQKMLCVWSRMYDNIYESSECPHDSVIEDDDMLDGWMISQRRKREKDQIQKEGNELVGNNSKIQNAREVYVVCRNEKDIWGNDLTNDTRAPEEKAKRVDSLNDSYGQMIKKVRLDILKEKGEVKETDMPDVRLELMTEMNKMFSERLKG